MILHWALKICAQHGYNYKCKNPKYMIMCYDITNRTAILGVDQIGKKTSYSLLSLDELRV